MEEEIKFLQMQYAKLVNKECNVLKNIDRYQERKDLELQLIRNKKEQLTQHVNLLTKRQQEKIAELNLKF